MSDLHSLLERSFDQALFVHREELDDLSAAIAAQRLVLLYGHAGCGKTTLLKRLVSANTTTGAVRIYLNLKQEAAAIEHADNQTQFVFQLLMQALRAEITSKNRLNLSNDLLAYYLRYHSDYEALRASIQFESQPDTTGEWLQALSIPTFREERRRVDLGRHTVPESEVHFLLRFLSSKQHHTVIVVDNIDRFSLELQSEIVEGFIDICAQAALRVSPILAVRYATLRRLRARDDNSYLFFVEHLETTSPLPSRRAMPGVRLSTQSTTLASFLTRRLRFVASGDALDSFMDREMVVKFSQHLRCTPSQFLADYESALGLLSTALAYNPITDDLTHWCNNSLRTTAMYVFNFLSAVLVDREPQLRISSLFDAVRDHTKADEIRMRKVRSALYRHLICTPHSNRTQMRCIDLFHDTSSVASERTLHFLDLHLLEYLAFHPDRRVTVRELKQDFARLGVPPATVEDRLNRIIHPRGAERPGLAFVDLPDHDLVNGIPDSAHVEALPATEYLVTKLAPSCEYLFWSAMYSDEAVLSLPHKITWQDIDDDTFRLDIAAEYLETSIAPRLQAGLVDYVSHRDLERAASIAKFCSRFGHPHQGGKLFTERAVILLRRFTQGIERTQDQPSETRIMRAEARLSRIESGCHRLRGGG